MQKIDFVGIISVTAANPNGDPLSGNRPRETYDGRGEISDVCLKRKIRNRLQQMGESVFVQMQECADDGCTSLSDRFKAFEAERKGDKKDRDALVADVCARWIDVRSFGQLFAFKGGGKSSGISLGVRGPVTIQSAFSVDPVDISTLQITKSVNSEPTKDGNKSSDTMGMKHRVDFGLYVLKGSISSYLAERTGFTDDDAEKIREALRTLFDNDASSARPDGSMNMERLYWFTHDAKGGNAPTAKVHDSVRIAKKEGVISPRSMEDYVITYVPVDGVHVEEESIR